MNFYSATYLLLLLLIPVLFVGAWLTAQAREKAREKFAPEHLFSRIANPEPQSRIFVRTLLAAIALVFLILSFARPQGGQQVTEEEVVGIDILLAIDVSRSMLAADLYPNRLTAIKTVTNEFIDSSYGDRIGVVAFAGDAVVVCPLTTDHGSVLGFIDRLTTEEPLRPGTGIGNAIHVGVNRLKQSEGGRVMILLTDGENNKGMDPIEAAAEAKSEGVRIYTVGVGTTAGAPLPDQSQSMLGTRYRTDDRGNTIKVGLDVAALEKIAQDTGGKYFQVSSQRQLHSLYSNITHEDETRFQARRIVRREELAPYFLFIAALFLILEAFYSYITPAEVRHAKA